MHDQANDLRRLVRQVTGTVARRAETRSRLIVAAGGKGGVGTTTVAVNLAVAIAQSRRRVALVDANPHGAGTSLFCRVPERFTLADVLLGGRTIREALVPGPAGIQFLPGSWGAMRAWDCCSLIQDQFLEQLAGLGNLAEFIIVDAGNGSGRWERRFWEAAERVLVVTTPETPAIMNAYAAVKTLAVGSDRIRVQTLVNMAPSAAAADEVHERLSRACLRFLGFRPDLSGWIPWAAEVVEAGRRSEPFVAVNPKCSAASCLRGIADALMNDRPRANQDIRNEEDRLTGNGVGGPHAALTHVNHP